MSCAESAEWIFAFDKSKRLAQRWQEPVDAVVEHVVPVLRRV
jgi:hypothetical protein